MPWFVLFDYVKVYKYDPSTEQFNLYMKDDFDNFEPSFWTMASGRTENNTSVFYPENVSVKAGNLVIKMETERQ